MCCIRLQIIGLLLVFLLFGCANLKDLRANIDHQRENLNTADNDGSNDGVLTLEEDDRVSTDQQISETPDEFVEVEHGEEPIGSTESASSEHLINTKTEMADIWKYIAQLGKQRNTEAQLIFGHIKAFQTEMIQKIGSLEQKLGKQEEEWKQKIEEEKKRWNVLWERKIKEEEEKGQRDEQWKQNMEEKWKEIHCQDGSEDVWRFEERAIYRWKNWRLIRTNGSLIIWSDTIALELLETSTGWIQFFMNGRLGILYSTGTTDYHEDDADNRAKFIDKLHKAKAAIPYGVQAKSILSNPLALQTIQYGNWDLSGWHNAGG